MPQRRSVPRVCEQCGSDYLTTPQNAPKSRFCKAACRDAFPSVRLVERIRVPCGVCGKPVDSTPGQIANGRGKHCSKECRDASYVTHGEKGTPEWAAWQSMKSRCLNPNDQNYHNYGGRGITVHAAWIQSFETFLADVGYRPNPTDSLDRKKNNLGYFPGNVRWANKTEQARNTRRNRLITFEGVTDCMAGWAERIGMSPEALSGRLKAGWSIEKAITTPKGTQNRWNRQG